MTQDMKVYGKFTDMFKYVIKRADVLRSLFLLFTLMTLGAGNAWAQDDYSGVYYIANYKLEENSGYYSTSDLTKNYYLCPTEGYVFFQSPKNYSASDTGMPFLTTYKARNHADYDLRKMVWIIKKSGDYYTIRHALTGKYITYNEQIEGTSNAGRMRFHLQESDDPGDNMKFQINNPTGSRYTLCPKNSNSNSLNPAAGNKDKLTADGGSGGPTGVSVGGIVGQYASNNEGSQWVLEEAVLFPTITIDDATGIATITSEEGTTIRYALDDATPTIDGTSYTSPIDISGHTAIKAIAVRTSDNKVSVVATIPLKEYTYHIVNKAGTTAITHTLTQIVGKSLSDYNDIPAAIRSPYLEGEDLTFLSNFTDFDHLDDYRITETPSTGTDIYVVYTTTHLRGKFLHLSGARPLNLKVNGDYVYDSGTTGTGILSHTSSETDIATNPYFWFFEGEDPYAINIRNAATNNIIGYATPSLSPTSLTLNTSPANSKFIIMATSGGGEYQQMELMAATGDNTYYRVGYTDDAYNISTTATGDASLQIQAYPNSATITYKLIDQAGKILLNIETKSDAVELPSDWQSPLVDKYNYWKVGAFDITGDVYKLKADPESFRINNITDAEGNVIYVTYEVNDKVTFDISDDDKTHSGEYQTYMLRFYEGQNFNQENGTDGIETTPQQAEYPYSNGDAMLYVYSDTRRATQFTSGASTRPRWLWYAVSPKEAKIGETSVTPGYKGDPYHVKIMSHSADVKSKTDPDNTKHQNFFRTYLVNYGGSDHVVTGLTTKHADVIDQAPTEYMVLSAPNGRYKLVTLNEIEGAPDNGSYGKRQTVNTFEQYWKNNPTVQNRLGDAKVTVSESATDDIELTELQASLLTGWHTYQKWAQAAPWVSWSEDGKTGKKYQNKHHWFQTIDMGATGEFTFEAATLEPEVILLDQHGWEIMRAPLSDAAALRKYDSPMVQEYQWYPTAAKVTGYHKYKVSDPKIIVYKSYVDAAGKTKWQNSGNTYTHTSTSLADNPYDHFTEHGWELQDQSVKTDFYVTYTVKPEYARLYAGAATEGAVTPSAFMVKQGNEYAKISDSNTLTPTTDNPYALPTIGDEWHWYVKPNFNIDKEMGYEYDVEEDDGAGGTYTPNQAQKDAKNYEEGRNGFDPYNIQIQSVKNDNYYFKITTTGSHLNKGAWEGSSTDLSLKNMSAGRQENVDGNDQTKLSITNATFMVIKDASGNMLLMPRFDHTKVVNSFSGEQLSAPNAATKTLELIMAPKIIHSSNEFASLNGQYTLAEDFTFESDFTSLGSSDAPFTGSIDGALHKLSGLSNLTTPLIAYADGAIIKNIILDEVTIGNAENVPNVGAIVANARGETRIYNCGINSGSVGGSGDVGGIVGNLHGEEITVDGKKKYIGARVINCYSYATITGGTNVGGIVGNNDFASTTASNIVTMVMNCMFYGDITGGTTVSPVYGGNNIANLQGGLNTFNYYAYDELKTTAISANKYNSALAVEEKYLNRFEFYRLLLNSNKKLAAFYATSEKETVKPSDMMKWVLETADRSIAEPKPYPVLKAQGYYPSIINYDVENAPDSAFVGRNHGGKLGDKKLSVTISGVGSNAPEGARITTGSLTLQRTDKDFDRFNFNYDKVQLPYYNDVGTGNYTENKVVTGWKITAITAVAGDPYTADNYPTSGIKDFPDHNYADRKSSNKDLYSVSKRVFSQGAYFDVPYGVTSITIEPYWANAIYVADKNYDVVYKNDYSGKQNTGTGTQITTFNGQSVKNSITGLGSGTTVYDNAVVLVGNFHLDGVPSNGTTPFTMMSVDEDNDHEPDYSLIYHHKKRLNICPIRFDFLNVIGTAQAQKPNGANLICNFTICKTKGWFEVTNTALIYSSQFEYENLGNGDGNDNKDKVDAPLILLGGVFDQFVSTQSSDVNGKVYYIHVGGNVWIKEFGLGTHSDGSKSTPHVPVSVTGGEFEGFYLTGTYNANATVRTDNAECYISGGHFGEVAGASLEQIDGNVRWQIYDADIDNFFGGGINEAKPIKGDVTTDIYNSHVTLFCGGPKFGNMQTGKTVTTTAEGCTFGKFFGAGYGGTSIAKKKYYDKDGTQDWGTLQGYYTTDRGKYFNGATTGSSQTAGKDYGKKGLGVATDFDYEFFVWSSGATGARLFVNFASFSLAQCNDVESNLKGCTINQSFYGGGSLGKVVGKATSVLDGCTVHGNVFGGGYSADIPTIQVRDAGFTTNPNYNSSSGMFEPGVFSGTTEFTWKNAKEAGLTLKDGESGSDLTNHYVYTNADLTALGQVGETDLTIMGNTSVEGNVFGGGDESAITASATATGNTKVTIKENDTHETPIVSNVYGGGNTADVDGNTEVEMTNGTVSQDIFGGGKGQTTVVGGNVEVNIGPKGNAEKPLSVRDVYGGSALGAVNTTQNTETGKYDKTTTVNVYGGTVTGSVFGGGRGDLASLGDGHTDIDARNFGPTSVNMEGGTVSTAVYGGSNINGVLKKDATVTLIGGTIGSDWGGTPPNPLPDVVFGGGKGAPTLVNGNVTVNVGTMTPATPPAVPTYTGTATIYGHVYGGGELGNTNASKPESELVFDATKKTRVNLYAGTINGYAYGGALGSAETPAYVGGDVIVTLDGAKVQQVFGANNINGTPKGHVLVHVKRTVNSEKDDSKTREQRTIYDVEAVYGGGNMADYVPTNATLVTDPDAEGYDPGNAAKVAAATAEVLIEGCQKTSINYVYGGGNAAAVPATDVTVKGSYIINTLYGGGNGSGYMDPPTNSIPNPGANIGIYKNGETPTNYGTGKAVTKLLGGYINNVYGGSNTKGDVRGGTDVSTKKQGQKVTGDCCSDLYVGEIYGAGSHADVKGDVNITLDCLPDEFVDAVYGGAEEAVIEGNVTLTVTSGRFGRVFGGNNKGGNIQGSITVNIYEDGCKPLIIGEVYGGGNAAPYSIYGCSKDGGTWTPNTKETLYFNQETEGRAAIQVNIIACTSVGKVFGGGMGATAKVIGNTNVDVNLLKGIVEGVKQSTIGKVGQVFGGGGKADVIGNTLVEVGTKLANEGEDEGVNITRGTYTSSSVGTYLNPEANEFMDMPSAGIYGGGLAADVDGNTTLNIGTKDQRIGEEPSVTIAGDIFGGGLGETTHVTGNVTVNIGADTGVAPAHNYVGYAQITGDVYGGSAKGTVNSADNVNATTDSYTKVNFYGGAITGNIYGGGEGQREAAATPAVYYVADDPEVIAGSKQVGDVKTPAQAAVSKIAANVFGPVTVTMEKGITNTVVNNVFGCNNFYGTPKDTVAVIINGGTVNHNVYGGGDEAEYTPTNSEINYPAVYINNGTITENVFGGGLGTTATVTGNPHVTIGDNVDGHAVTIKKSVYGGGSLATVDGSTNIVMNSGTIGTEGEGGATYGNIYGGGLGSSAGVQIGIVKKNTEVIVKGGNVLHNIYGGGAYGSVGTYNYNGNVITGLATENTGKATITILGGTIGTDGHENGMIFGASRGDIAAPGAIEDNMAWVYDTEVIIGTSGQGTDAPQPQIKGSVYGSGENGHTFNDASVTIHSGRIGITDTSIDGGADYEFRGNVYGGGCGTDKYWIDANSDEIKDASEEHYNLTAGIVGRNTTVTIDGGHVVRNVYGGGAMGSVTGGTTVNISGNTEIGYTGMPGGYVYAASRGNDDMEEGFATVGGTTLNISGGTIWHSAFGGGQLGAVKGSVAVNVSGGVVKEDVYGGGALANTNTDNWNFTTPTVIYLEASHITYPSYKSKGVLEAGTSVKGLYIRSGDSEPYTYTLQGDENTADGSTEYFERNPGSIVKGLYTKSGDVYSAAEGEAVKGTTYYERRDLPGTWKEGKTSASNTTIVRLTGGVIGNAYGGGLGNSTTPVYVCGDVTLNVNKKEEISEFGGEGVGFTALTNNNVTVEGDDTKYVVTLTGRVFGCNNINGTPLGDVRVNVYSTRQLAADGSSVVPHVDASSHISYEIQAVYGGGNQSDYVPASGKSTHVFIDGCNETTIKKVYGGGSSASVPASDVLINAALDIGFAFGGGNGGELVNVNGVWQRNAGASVNGLSKIECRGGKIGQVFGGSDSKGNCLSTSVTQSQVGDCPLIITRMYGAGNEADVTGDVNIVISGCTAGNSQIEYICGGSYNAHITGNVTLTITSGFFKSVFGGNESTGGIGGAITVNIEESDECKPIIIGDLVGGGNMAPYPGTNSDGTPITTPGNITVNVKSATRIDNIYGGGYESEVRGNTQVNINMKKGYWAGKTYDPDGIAMAIPDAVGAIGNVFGGGNAGRVVGNATVNIGTEKTVRVMKRNAQGKLVDSKDELIYDESGNFCPGKSISSIVLVDSPVIGARITGNVYGGGREGDVTGNTYVNICAKETATLGTYAAVAEGSDKVTIAGNVYGGGKGIANSFTCEKAMVGIVDDGATVTGEDESATYTLKEGGTTVTIGHGTVGTLEAGKLVEGTGNVYGGGEIGRVERNTKVTIGIGNGTGETASPVIEGEVFGAGQGVATHGYSGLVRGNSTVTVQGDSWVKQSVYGAGKLASLGRYWIATTSADATAHNVEIGMPWGLKCGGESSVTIQGHAKIGPEAPMAMPTFDGNVFGAGKGALPYDVTGEPGRYYMNGGKYTWESYADESKEGDYLKYVETLGVTNNSIVTIGGDAFVMGSVYGGSMNGSVFDGTVVNIAGGQIGRSKVNPLPDGVWGANYTPTSDLECPSWPYASPHAPYDKYANSSGKYPDGSSADEGQPEASDGHTFYGNVFGGGSGKDPYKPGKWHRKAGYVGGNTEVNITGGHILTSVYGGNELTDVGSGDDLKVVSGKGKCTINMTGGTLGVPRTEAQIAAHPVTCYLFGAGKGDQRIFFNKWTNVSETEVNITNEARIYGSVFGGGEDGHVLGDVTMNIGDVTIGSTSYTGENVKIGMRGTSYVDGNVFGGGRGFSGEALTAGAVVGNVTMNISNGTMLGSIYGGGRLASVGTKLEDVTDGEGNPNPKYGLISDDTDTEEFGHIAITISGGTIGNGTTEVGTTHSVSGNVFGGSMGRITLLDGTRNSVWPKLAVAKLTNVTISDGTIYNSVYGGSEYGVVRNRATVNVEGGTIHGNVFGGGYGSGEQDKQTIEVAGYADTYYTFTPLIWTGCVSGDTFVNISGGSIKKNVYGGGNFASVGLIDFVSDKDGNFTNMPKHDNLSNGFGLSWPYKFNYHSAAPYDASAVGGGELGGKATVTITGGLIGTATGDGTGNVFGGSKGEVDFDGVAETNIDDQRYTEAMAANVRETEVNINYTSSDASNQILGAVYGGGQDGHVYEDAKVRITGGLIGLSVYGGGEGNGTYNTTLLDPSTGSSKGSPDNIHSWTAGKVYGNTSVSMSGGQVNGHVYGGGNLASVGKGNYAGGNDDYYPAGYGETLTGNLWTSAVEGDNAWHFLNSGKATVVIAGGSVGTANGTSGSVYGTTDATPTGMIFGGSRGRAAQDVADVAKLTTLYKYVPDFYLGYVNKAEVIIGGGHVCIKKCEAAGNTYKPGDFLSDADFTTIFGGSNANWTAGSAPTIYSQVFGGGRDGHVRNSAHVIINDGTIGQPYSDFDDTDAGNYQRYHRGNVYGSGSGLGQWTSGKHGMSSGSVTRNTTVDINGGTIYNNVYGGGALSSVGPPKLDSEKDYAASTWSKCVVNINGGTIGDVDVYNEHKYGGCVYGASRGNDFLAGESEENFATVLWTQVNINGGNLAGNVYGGAKGGLVWKDTEVHLQGGTIAHNAYGGGQGTSTIAANIGGNTTVKLNEGKDKDDSGCMVERIFGCNDLNGTPKGHALVHVYATQHKGTAKIVPDGGKYVTFNNIDGYSIDNYDGLVTLATNYSLNVTSYTSVLSNSGSTKEAKQTALQNMKDVVLRAELEYFASSSMLNIASEIASYKAILDSGTSTAEEKAEALQGMENVVRNAKYDVVAVYGGGDLAKYEPTDPTPETPLNDTEEYAKVIIDGCKLTSIRQVYGGGNAASAPATDVRINEAYEIHEAFGGGNGRDNYQLDGKWYENPGANVGYYATYHHSGGDGSLATPYQAVENDGTGDYKNAKTKEARIENYSYGAGYTNLVITGGRIHKAYGGSNIRGNIRYSVNSAYEESGSCPMLIDETYGGGNEAVTDGDIHTKMECVDYMSNYYGGSEKGDVNSDIVLEITNGTFGNVYGGNNKIGRILGSITINVHEEGCKPIIIDNLYACGDVAQYSIYGYSGSTHETVRTKAEWEALSDEAKAASPIRKDPRVNIISATRINNVYGGGDHARVIGSPHINVNMEEGTLLAKYIKQYPAYLTTDQTDTRISGTTVTWRCREGEAVGTDGHMGILPVGTIGNIFGGGNYADVEGNTYVEIGTGKHHNGEGEEVVITPARNAAYITGRVYGGGNLGDVTGNTIVEMCNGYVADRIYGGGKEGNVGTVTSTSKHTGAKDHEGCIGKPSAFAANTGKCTVTVSGGRVGPYTYSYGSDVIAKATPNAMTMPEDFGYVFGAGRGELTNPATDPDIDFRTYVKETEVIIKNTYEESFEGDSLDHIVKSPLIAGGVYGGSENGRVLNNTHVNIWGGQIGIGAGMSEAFNEGSRTSEAYAESDFINPTTTTVTDENKLAECAAWPYGKSYSGTMKWLPYDEHADESGYHADTYGEADGTGGSDGHTFYGNVFGGGSGYFAYAKGDGTYEWLPSAGLVEGDTYVNISGGHILTNVYGGNELTNVTGTAHVTMTGGTLGVPRTLTQIAAHPVTCYLFGGGKGDQRVHFNMSTNVGHAVVNVSGGTIYGSVFGGGEDGHVLGNVTMNIGTAAVGTEGQDGYVAAAGPTIGTWGTSYVEGNVFGGGRGFAGDALTAGVVCGNVDMKIKGGTMLGSIYGGGRLGSIGTHLEPSDNDNYGKLIPDNRDENYVTGLDYVHEGSTHGYVTINISGGTIGNNNEYIIPQADNIPSGLGAYPKNWTDANWTTWKTANNVPNTDYVYDKDLGFVRLTHTKGGNVFAGAMGRMFALNGTTPLTRWYDLGMVKSTRLTITGGTIKSNVYGGGELGWTAGKHKHSNTALTATDSLSTEIVIRGGTIGTEVKEAGVTRYTFGSVYGGGYGNAMEKLSDETNPKFIAGRVVGATSVRMEDGEVKGSIFGGGEVANVGLGFYSYNHDIIGGTKGGFTKDDSGIAKTGATITADDIAKVSTYVDVSGGTVGIEPITVSGKLRYFGGATMGNVYGGGSGNRTIVRCGLVLGNSNVSISQAEGKTTRIYHNVYGGGSFGSVGDYEYESSTDLVTGTQKVDGVQKVHTPGTGTATVSITGGTIGSNGHENGMVFGSSRGDITNPHSRDNYMAWVNNATVTIGTKGGTYATPTVKGSVYGSGENGHTFGNTVVTVNSGTVGVPSDPVVVPDPSAPDDPEKATTYYGANYPFRGNVYGGGCGTDTYKENGEDKYNPEAGIVRGNTTVNINGGLIAHSVYGAGSMASVGTIGTDSIKHDSAENGFALSWPYEFTFAENTGKATVNIKGGHIGVQLTNGNIEIKGDGDVYGSARGEAGDRYKTAHFAYVRETEVNVEFPDTCTATFANYSTDLGKWCVTGSVHGSGENGYVYGDTHVTLKKGLIGHSLYGAGKGNGTYTTRIKRIYDAEEDDPEKYDAQIYSLIAGRVMGNTYVTMNDGHVGRNVYGGGNMGSVGKGNYAGGADDYYPTGYGEAINGKLWTSDTEGDNAWQFLNSGKTTVTITGGVVGYIDEANPTLNKNGLPYGNVFGGSAGEAAPNVPLNLDPRYEYCPAFFSGYVNETDVTIGTLGQDNDNAGQKGKAPRIFGSVYGGGQDGHVRRLTHVTVNSGVIGMPFTEANKTLLQQSGINDPQWLYRGCVYGGGSGISEFKFDFNGDGDYDDTYTIDGVEYKEMGFSNSSGSVTCFTTVDVLGGLVYRAVLGGGSLGSVGAPKINQTDYAERRTATAAEWGGQSLNQVNVGGGGKVGDTVVKATIGEPTGVDAGYGGNVFGGGRGEAGLGSDFGTSIWTQVNVKNGANILGNVYGGGNAGPVLKDTEVNIGEKATE